jgi:hypothetical protein
MVCKDGIYKEMGARNLLPLEWSDSRKQRFPTWLLVQSQRIHMPKEKRNKHDVPLSTLEVPSQIVPLCILGDGT